MIPQLAVCLALHSSSGTWFRRGPGRKNRCFQRLRNLNGKLESNAANLTGTVTIRHCCFEFMCKLQHDPFAHELLAARRCRRCWWLHRRRHRHWWNCRPFFCEKPEASFYMELHVVLVREYGMYACIYRHILHALILDEGGMDRAEAHPQPLGLIYGAAFLRLPFGFSGPGLLGCMQLRDS